MRALTYIRLATYALFLAAVFLVFHNRVHVITAQLWGYEDEVRLAARRDWLADYNRITKELEAIPRHKDFRDTRMSGSQVVAIANAAAKSDGTDLKRFREPEISLGAENGKLVWYAGFYEISDPPIPGGFFTVVIDDKTGQVTEIAPGM